MRYGKINPNQRLRATVYQFTLVLIFSHKSLAIRI